MSATELERFQRLRLLADKYAEGYEAGFYDLEQLRKDLNALRVIDDDGVEWKIGYPLDTWYKFEFGEWIPSFPPYPRNLLADPDEYIAKHPRGFTELKWKFAIRNRRDKHSLDGDQP